MDRDFLESLVGLQVLRSSQDDDWLEIAFADEQTLKVPLARASTQVAADQPAEDRVGGVRQPDPRYIN